MNKLLTLIILLLSFTELRAEILIGVTKSNFDAASQCGCIYKIKDKGGTVFIPELRNQRYLAAMNINNKEVVLERTSVSSNKCGQQSESKWCRSETYENSEYKVIIEQLSAKSLCGVSPECESAKLVSKFAVSNSKFETKFIGIGICAC